MLNPFLLAGYARVESIVPVPLKPTPENFDIPIIKSLSLAVTRIHIGRYATLGEAEVKVVRVKHVPPSPPPTPGCIDRHQLCSHWAESGECTDNAGYMVGTAGAPGDCIMSCNRCDLGPNDPKWTPASRSKSATVK